MSGVEIVGVLLGALPLCISALEHHEQTRKVAGTFVKIRRAHKKDLGKVKDCELWFRLNLKELLIPLLRDDVVDRIEYERLLANPGSSDWGVEHVDTALEDRLGDCHQRYIEILQEMQETTAALCEACRVNDDQFQQRLRQQQKSLAASTPTQQAQDQLLLRANDYVCFQAKRAKYAFAPTKREELLEELESQNNKLQNVLAASDRVSALTKQQTRVQKPAINQRMLNFWRHADNIFKLLKNTWHCTCRSCASLWLQQHPKRFVHMSIVLPFCHGRRAVKIELSDIPPVLQLPAPQRHSRPTSSTTTAGQLPTVSILANSSVLAIRSGRGRNTTTITRTAQATSVTVPQAHQTTTPSTAPFLQNHGLCAAFATSTANGQECLGRVTEGDDEYAVYPAVEKVCCSQGTSLADLLSPGAALKLTRVQRYGIALTLASSHLQLHSTPWLKSAWTSEDVLFPTESNGSVLTLHGEPYILANINPSNSNTLTSQKDRSFSTLGIVLLELCFGRRLEEHPMFLNSPYAALKADPIIRQTVACEWIDDATGEAGEEYAKAVKWTLQQSPALLKDDKWREEFAVNVVSPLREYYSYLHPSKDVAT
ncbi:uncharacterized protein LTR77_009826 [Saxophila tyrrhenica]|uniref:DUF7580 domain-containing protein n=1 Tax=Saxophila tyrrhenica TaxID=1690608 RepID=A0AAV9NXX7_9PEZI|nr:hypothetical protein LTR77_009826 [Saxophila tyrrhenica]